jgi:phosphatidate cytidylyltransferase
MNNFMTRVLFVGIIVPLLFALILLVPSYNHLPIVVIILVFCGGSALELRRIVEPDGGRYRSVIALMMALIPPIAVYLTRLTRDGSSIVAGWLAPLSVAVIAAFSVGAIPLAFPRTESIIRTAVSRAGANALYLIYPGALSTAMVAILGAPRGAGMLLVWFAFMVFGNDSMAWLAGVTLGKHRGIFAVSPNKSLEGTIAGICGSLVAALLGPVVFPTLIDANWILLACLGLAIGVAVVTGDLLESALKRAAGVKDSGTIVPGRGGMLDSFDSLLLSAPLFAAFIAAMGLLP